MRNIINPEAIDEFIANSAQPHRDLPVELALKALRKALRNHAALYSPVVAPPSKAPPWMTPERIASGELYAFDSARCDYDLFVDVFQVLQWLRIGHHRQELSGRARRKWEKSLGHIRTLDEAVARAGQETEAWGAARVRANRRERERMMGHRPLKKPPPFCEQVARGEIVFRLRLSCGGRWYRLMTREALTLEGLEMDHCLGWGLHASLLHERAAAYFTLRNADLSPRLTVMVMDHGVNEVGRHGNLLATAEDARAIDHLLAAEGPLNLKTSETAFRTTEPDRGSVLRMLRPLWDPVLARLRLRKQVNEWRAGKGLPPLPSRSARRNDGA